MADGSPVWKDPEIAGVRALLAGFATPPGSPEPTFEARRSGMDAFGEMSPLPAGLTKTEVDIDGVPAERLSPANAVEGRAMRAVTRCERWGTSRTRTRVMTASVPSLPHSNPARS